MNAMKNKIKSQRGASITFALLLFLVCAIISGIVVVAATAAAGRMSQRAEIDQRYYAVTSAAGLLRDNFNDMLTTVQYKIIDGSATNPEAIKVVDTTTSQNKQLSDYMILKDASEKMVEKIIKNNLVASADPDREFELSSSLTDPKASLGCTIKEYIYAGKKQLRFVISNAPPTGVVNPSIYTLQVVMNANISQSSSEYTEDGKKTTVVTTDIAWKLANIKKGVV